MAACLEPAPASLDYTLGPVNPHSQSYNPGHRGLGGHEGLTVKHHFIRAPVNCGNRKVNGRLGGENYAHAEITQAACV